MAGSSERLLPFDPFRRIVFPNRMRARRIAAGFARLILLSNELASIPYIRLSKIERGEVVPRPAELRLIAGPLRCDPLDLLFDADQTDALFDSWAEEIHGPPRSPTAEDRDSLLLAAAIRARRASDARLTIADIQERFGIAPVVLSRLENTQKPLTAWNETTRHAIRRLLDADSDEAMLERIRSDHARGALDSHIDAIDGREGRLERIRERIAELRERLATEAPVPPTNSVEPGRRLLPISGGPAADGRIAERPTGMSVVAPEGVGSRAFAIRLGRPSLGIGLPAHSILFADPEVHPVAGGLAVVRENEGFRVLAVTADQHGQLSGHSIEPAYALSLKDIPAESISAVVAARFI